MALFRRKGPEIVRKSSAGGTVEEHKTVRVKGQKVEVRRVEALAPSKPKKDTSRRSSNKKATREKSTGGASGGRNGLSTSRTRSRRPADEEIIVPNESARKQMLVSANKSQTQIVILEGPVLVEHYVAREDSNSVAGNIYLAIARNVLPGM